MPREKHTFCLHELPDGFITISCASYRRQLEREPKTRLFETNENEYIDSPTPRNEAKTPHCKRYDPRDGAHGRESWRYVPTVYQ